MALRDLSAFLEDDALEVPVKSGKHPDGKTYRIASPDATTGLWLTALADLGVKAGSGGELDEADLGRLRLDDDQEREFVRVVLGSTMDELTADGVSWVRIQRLSRYAFLWFTVGPEAADKAVESGTLAGEASAPNREQRRTASRAGATTTKPRASTAGTTSRRKPAQKPTAPR